MMESIWRIYCARLWQSHPLDSSPARRSPVERGDVQSYPPILCPVIVHPEIHPAIIIFRPFALGPFYKIRFELELRFHVEAPIKSDHQRVLFSL
jgi:hypothetical protein